MNDRQLQWAVANRRRFRVGQPVSELVADFPMARWKRGEKRWGRLVEFLEAELGAQLLSRLTIRSMQRGVLVLEPDEPAEACLLEFEHAARLADRLRALPSAVGVAQVQFRPRSGKPGEPMVNGHGQDNGRDSR